MSNGSPETNRTAGGEKVEEQDELQLPQDRETPVQTVSRGAIVYRYGYARSAETRDAQQPGQDYVALRVNDQTLAFALCDGVGESFYGDLAARFLGNKLVDWLWEEAHLQQGRDSLRASLNQKLHEWTEPASELVQSQSIPLDIPTLQREALEKKRSLGSQSTFVCGRIDLAGETYAEGRAFFAWLGDSRLRIWGESGELTAELGETFDSGQRWVSSRGPLGGGPHVFLAPLRQGKQALTALMAYSDGLAALDQAKESPSNRALQELIDGSGEAATSDDISFLEAWLGRRPTWAEVKAAPLPAQLQALLSDGQIRAAWQPVTGATQKEPVPPTHRHRVLPGALVIALVFLVVSIGTWILKNTQRGQMLVGPALPSLTHTPGPKPTGAATPDAPGTAAAFAQATAEAHSRATATVQSQQTAVVAQTRHAEQEQRLAVAPVLQFPASGAELPLQEVTLRWQWTGTLAENECYRVNVRRLGQLLELPSSCTTDTKYELPQLPAGEYRWSIVVVRPAGYGPDGSRQWQAVSRESETWSFTLSPGPGPSPSRTPKI